MKHKLPAAGSRNQSFDSFTVKAAASASVSLWLCGFSFSVALLAAQCLAAEAKHSPWIHFSTEELRASFLLSFLSKCDWTCTSCTLFFSVTEALTTSCDLTRRFYFDAWKQTQAVVRRKLTDVSRTGSSEARHFHAVSKKIKMFVGCLKNNKLNINISLFAALKPKQFKHVWTMFMIHYSIIYLCLNSSENFDLLWS